MIRALRGLEHLGCLRTRYRTGLYLAMIAEAEGKLGVRVQCEQYGCAT